MNPSTTETPRVSAAALRAEASRLDYLDATRAFALVLGIVFHASLSFLPMFVGWAVQDISTSRLVGIFVFVSHSFRMETFFLLAGFFAHLSLHRKGSGDFVRARAIRIGVPFVVGWFVLRPLLASGWIMGGASLRGDYDFWAGILAGVQSLATFPRGLFTGSHLWFLYYLAMITALTLALRGLAAKAGAWHSRLVRRADALVAWLANSPYGLLVLVAPTAAALWFMHFWGVDTPQQSLRPQVPVLVIYGGFFVFGWMLDRQRELIPRFARLTPKRWILAAVGLVGSLLLLGMEHEPGHPRHLEAHIGFVLSYALMMWTLVFLTIGVFGKLFQRSRAWVRYVADSSYWLYLIHLPVVVWLQVAVAEFQLHWSLKLAGISIATLVVALLSYDLFVRATAIGWVLNGRRRPSVLAGLLFRRIRDRRAAGETDRR